MATPIAIAVVEQDGRFLIGQRPPDVPLAGYWEFPGGKIEPGETSEAAAVRECLEEAGIAVEALFQYPPHVEPYRHGSVQLHFIGCRPLSLTQTPTNRFQWVARHDLGNYEFPAGNRALLQTLVRPPTSDV